MADENESADCASVPNAPEEPASSTEPVGPSPKGTAAEAVDELHTDDASAGRPDPPRDPGRIAAGKETSGQTLLNYTFNGPVHTPNGAFGVTAGGRQVDRRTEEGWLREADMDAALARHVAPDGAAEAADALRHDGLVVLHGPPGIGKRVGGLALLRSRRCDRALLLSRATSLKDLASRTYGKGNGYLVVDRRDDAGGKTDADVQWLAVRDRVADAGATLVVTTTGRPTRDECVAVAHVAWERPRTREVLKEYLPAANDAEIERLTAVVPPGCPMVDLAAFARRIADGDSVGTAALEFELAAAEDVAAWFETPRSRGEVLGLTALAFFPRITVRELESVLEKLEATVTPLLPPVDDAEPAVGFDRRSERIADGSLITVSEVDASPAPRSLLDFRSENHRRAVFRTLSRRMELPYWRGVRAWIGDLLRTEEPARVADGLRWLAEVDYEEVEVCYLRPWSAGEAGLRGQAAAVWLLWLMCYNEDLLPAALDEAVRCACASSVSRRRTAMFAFSGELGLRYPTAAIRRLWQITTQSNDLTDEASDAIERLFTVYAEASGGGGSALLAMLKRQIDRSVPRGANDPMFKLAMAMALRVLSVRSLRMNRRGELYRASEPAVVQFLRTDARRIESVVGVWAAVLRQRPYRLRALQALWRALDAVRQFSDRPQEEATALGEALALALPRDERWVLRRDFLNYAQRAQRGDESNELVDAFLAAMERRLHMIDGDDAA